jgi:hypothetical protein
MQHCTPTKTAHHTSACKLCPALLLSPAHCTCACQAQSHYSMHQSTNSSHQLSTPCCLPSHPTRSHSIQTKSHPVNKQQLYLAHHPARNNPSAAQHRAQPGAALYTTRTPTRRCTACMPPTSTEGAVVLHRSSSPEPEKGPSTTQHRATWGGRTHISHPHNHSMHATNPQQACTPPNPNRRCWLIADHHPDPKRTLHNISPYSTPGGITRHWKAPW